MPGNVQFEEHFVCIACSVAPVLKQVVENHGGVATCSLCGTADVVCAATRRAEFVMAIKALIRYNFGEWQYHSKLGDGSLEMLFFIDPNPILKIIPGQTDVDREDVVLSFLDDIIEQQPQIDLITAFGRDIYNYLPKTPVSAGRSSVLGRAREALGKRNRFLVEEEFVKEIEPAVTHVASKLAAGTRWFRARLGAKLRAAKMRDVGAPMDNFYEPHADETLGAPPVGSTSAGRVNRPGVSYLYLASDATTAASEIRPHPGELVSMGCFDLTKDQRVADLRAHDLTKLWRSDEELELLELIIAMEMAFATAAPPSNRGPYSITQFLGELFRQLGFDGVLFRSTVSNGDNLVLFDPSAAVWVDGTSGVSEITRVLYEFEDRQMFDSKGRYDVDYDRMRRRAAA